MDMKDNIWVYSDLAGRYAELAGGVSSLGGKAQAIVVGSANSAAKAAASGVGKVHHMAFDEAGIVDNYLPGMVKLIQSSGDSFLVLVAATKRGRLMGARLAARLGAAVVSDVNGISMDADGLTVTHSVYGGLAQGTEKITASKAVLLVAPGAFDAPESAADSEVVAAEAETSDDVKCLGHHPKQASNIDIGRARRVVGVGRGLKAKEDLAMVDALAQSLDAEVGCSRPVAEDGMMEHERYIGITGVKLKSDIYVALGISGQVQHLAGINACRTIVAVNKDKNAPIFQHADYGLVGDLNKVVPALTKLLAQ